MAKKETGERPNTKKDAKGRPHLPGSFAALHHDCDADHRAGQDAEKNRKRGQAPPKISSYHKHHFRVTEAHRLDAAHPLPKETSQPKRTATEERADRRANQ